VIRQRLLKAQSTIELSLKVAGGLRSFCERLRKDDDSFSKDVWVPELETYITRLSSHNHSLRRLLDVAQGTMTLVCNLIICLLPNLHLSRRCSKV
jgi:hypothetical protein